MKIFCSGIGGIGLSAYAAYMKSAGHTVSGSDVCDSALIHDLQSQGIPVALEQDGNAIPEDADLFVHTLALRDDHPERQKAHELHIATKTYFEALGDLTRGVGTKVIAVCGTHGKSSTTAMAAKVLINAGLDPSVILGTKMKELGNRNWRKAAPRGTEGALRGGYFLVEACEYRHSFLHLSPDIIILTNADGDHFDFFKTHREYLHAFEEFIARLPNDGALITHLSDKYCGAIAKHALCKVLDADRCPSVALKVPGSHMQQNAKLVLALADLLDLPRNRVLESLSSYTGCWRRMELKGKAKNGALIIDDYGHHPTEVSATLKALREAYPLQRIVCIFQPHTHDRTLKLYDQFLNAFRDVDDVVIPNVYDARRDRDAGVVDLTKFVKDIAEKSKVNAIEGKGLHETPSLIRKTLRKDDVVITMGAGDVWQVGESLLA